MISIYIETYGCQMNVSDTELVEGILENYDFEIINDPKLADIALLNTCAVREGAELKVINRIALIKQNYPTIKIGILGCMAIHLKDQLLKNKYINFIVGPDNYRNLPNLIDISLNQKEKIAEVEFDILENYENLFPKRHSKINAWIPITRGCNNFCSYCVVPYTRGRERSRNPYEIIKEITKLVNEEGIPQITLLGQNVNSYNSNGINFVELLAKISDIKNLPRIRFVSPHPKDLSQELIDLVAERKNICKHIHLPLQAGSTKILNLMNRTYTKDNYLELVNKIKKKIPNITLTTDIIVGFPFESDDDFMDTYDVVKKVKYDSAFIFKYSVRTPSLASKKFEDNVSEKLKTKRIVMLNALQKKISLKKNMQKIGSTQKILIDSIGSKKDTKALQGRTDGNLMVILQNADYKIGEWVDTKIYDATANILKGIPI